MPDCSSVGNSHDFALYDRSRSLLIGYASIDLATKLIHSSLQSDTLDISFGAEPPPLFLIGANILADHMRTTRLPLESAEYRGFDSLEIERLRIRPS